MILLIVFIGWFLLYGYYYWNIMKLAKWWFQSYPRILFQNTQSYIILTIDDVPYSNTSFKDILDVFDEYPNSKATFFVISSYVNDSNRHLLIRALKSGHHLANHGRTSNMHALFGHDSLHAEIEHCQSLLRELYREAEVDFPKVNYYRPGSGYVSKVIYDYCEKNNYRIVLGSNYCSDPHIPIPVLNEWYIMKHLRNNDIIILHDRSWSLSLFKNLFLNRNLQTSNLLNYRDDKE